MFNSKLKEQSIEYRLGYQQAVLDLLKIDVNKKGVFNEDVDSKSVTQ